MSLLRNHLFQAYGGFTDKRRKDPSQDCAIQIDDKDHHDVYPYFCHIWVRVPHNPPETLILTLQHIALTPEVQSLIRDHGGSIRQIPGGHTAEITLKARSITFIRRLARTIRKAVSRGKRYTDPNWKWICPRTAGSLDRLAEVLRQYKAEHPPVDSPGSSSRRIVKGMREALGEYSGETQAPEGAGQTTFKPGSIPDSLGGKWNQWKVKRGIPKNLLPNVRLRQ